MEQALYILFGWFLGLISPVIIDEIKLKKSKKRFFKALCSEAHDLQFRVALIGFLLAQNYVKLDREYLLWIRPIFENYKGNEPHETGITFIDKLLELEEKQFQLHVDYFLQNEDIGLSLKTYSVSFLETNIGLISEFPIDLQVKIHEFRTHLSLLNQQSLNANESFKMTFDSSMTDENHTRIKSDLIKQYIVIHGMCNTVVKKLNNVVTSTL